MVTPTLTPLPILITEVFPKPSQGEEWVELYNPNTTAIQLSDWELWDELSQPSLVFSFTTQTIGGNQWLIVPINRKLNDTEDGVTLKTSGGQVSDAMHYSNSETDKSWARFGTTSNSPWNLSSASPGNENPIPTPTSAPQPTATSTPEPTATVTPTKTPSLTPTLITTLTPAPTSTPKAPSLPIASGLHQKTTAPIPTQAPLTPTLIPTLSLEKPSEPPPHSQTKNPKLPSLYYVGLLLIQLSAIGMSLTKQGMIKADAVAPIP